MMKQFCKIEAERTYYESLVHFYCLLRCCCYGIFMHILEVVVWQVFVESRRDYFWVYSLDNSLNT